MGIRTAKGRPFSPIPGWNRHRCTVLITLSLRAASTLLTTTSCSALPSAVTVPTSRTTPWYVTFEGPGQESQVGVLMTYFPLENGNTTKEAPVCSSLTSTGSSLDESGLAN